MKANQAARSGAVSMIGRWRASVNLLSRASRSNVPVAVAAGIGLAQDSFANFTQRLFLTPCDGHGRGEVVDEGVDLLGYDFGDDGRLFLLEVRLARALTLISDSISGMARRAAASRASALSSSARRLAATTWSASGVTLPALAASSASLVSLASRAASCCADRIGGSGGCL